jgi:alpha-D-xyloside xylohydrolase
MEYSRSDEGIQVAVGEVRARLTWYGIDILRVQAWRGPERTRQSLSVVAVPNPPERWSVVEQNGRLAMRGLSLSATIDRQGTIRFRRGTKALLGEIPGTRGFPRNGYSRPEDEFGVEQSFALHRHEALYGLGQFPDGILNWRGQSATLIHGNVTVVVPFLVSTRGWGMLWDHPSHTEFRDDSDGMRLWSEVADGLDYYVCAGDTLDDVIRGYRRLTGSAPLFARSFYGFIQCKERYQTAREMVEVVQEHRNRRIPLDVIVQDWQYWGPGMDAWSGMVHDPETYGDLPGAIDTIHNLHAKVMISIWPRIGLGTALGRELAEAGHLFEGKPDSRDKVYDAFSREARAIYWKYVRDGLFNHGIDAWWMDGTEPEFKDCHITSVHKASLIAQRDTAAGSWARLLNAYSLATTQGVYEGQRAATDRKRVFILTRSAWAGQQRNAAATWSGDISASWETFRRQIPAGLNFCLSGIPYWTTDNGAFFVRGRGGVFPEGVKDPAFREFFLRWFQYSCFCPLMRSHGTQTPREIWHFGAPGDVIYDTLVAFDRLRMRLLPYSYSLAAMTTFDGYTPMRALVMDFPAELRLHDVADQFMYGPAIMVCPVTQPCRHPPSLQCETLTAWRHCLVDGQNGMRVRTYDGLNGEEPAEERVSREDLDHCWSGNKPAGVTRDDYRVEISCDLVCDVAEGKARTLIVRVAGLLRVELDGNVVVDDWQDGSLREHRVRVPSRRGGAIPLRIVYGHVQGDAVLMSGWSLSGERGAAEDGTAQSRKVLLPAPDWYDFWTGMRHEGGYTVNLPVELDRIPVFIRAGSVLPLGPVKQWHDERPDDPMEIRVYPGADGECVLYEDEGDGYRYETGAWNRIRFHWSDRDGILTIGDREGAFPGMLEARTFHVVLVSAYHGHGSEESSPDRTVRYTGATCAVPLISRRWLRVSDGE